MYLWQSLSVCLSVCLQTWQHWDWGAFELLSLMTTCVGLVDVAQLLFGLWQCGKQQKKALGARWCPQKERALLRFVVPPTQPNVRHVQVNVSASVCVYLFYNHSLWRPKGQRGDCVARDAAFYVTISTATATATAFVFINVAITF